MVALVVVTPVVVETVVKAGPTAVAAWMVAAAEPTAAAAMAGLSAALLAAAVARTPHTPQTQHAQLRNRW